MPCISLHYRRGGKCNAARAGRTLPRGMMRCATGVPADRSTPMTSHSGLPSWPNVNQVAKIVSP